MARTPARPTPPPTYSITGAQRAHHEDMGARMAKYAISMGIRTACFVFMVLAALWLHVLWLAAVFMVGAVFLPYFAVLIANAGRERLPVARGAVARDQPSPVPPPAPAPAAGSAPGHGAQGGQDDDEHVVIRVTPTRSRTAPPPARIGPAAEDWRRRSAS